MELLDACQTRQYLCIYAYHMRTWLHSQPWAAASRTGHALSDLRQFSDLQEAQSSNTRVAWDITAPGTDPPHCACLRPAGLSVQLLLYPDSLKNQADDDDDALPKGPQLPKVGITAKPEELRAAFREAERMGKQEGAKDAAARRAGDSGLTASGGSGSSGSSIINNGSGSGAQE